MQSIDKEGKNVQDALQAALSELGKSIEEVEYDVLDEGSKGILGVGAKPALIRVTVKEAQEFKQARELILKIFDSLGLNATIDAIITDNSIIKINIESEDSGILIGRQGKTLEALQYLLNQILHFENYRILLDISNYRQRHTERISEMAKRVAHKVRETRRKITLNPMTSAERKTVHEAVQEIKDVQTSSIGEEPDRRVIIAPNRPSYSRTRDDSPPRGERDNSPPRGERNGGGYREYNTRMPSGYGRTPGSYGREQGSSYGRTPGSYGREQGSSGRTPGSYRREQGSSGRTPGSYGREQGNSGRTPGSYGREQGSSYGRDQNRNDYHKQPTFPPIIKEGDSD